MAGSVDLEYSHDAPPPATMPEPCLLTTIPHTVGGSSPRDAQGQPDAVWRTATAPADPGGAAPTAQPLAQRRVSSSPVSQVQPELEELSRQPSALRLAQTASSNWMSNVTRNVSTTIQRNITPALNTQTVRCSICLESTPASDCVVLENCGREAHSTCVDCLSIHLKMRVSEGRVTELWCPCSGDDGCDAAVTQGELERLLDPESLARCGRFRMMQQESKLRACPQCNELCCPRLLAPGLKAPGIIPEMTCESCGCAFCYYHSNAHAPGPDACAAHERRILKQEKQASAAVTAHKCPRCGVLTEKTSGCNHMTCKCKCEWCWVCGEEITNVGWHYNPLKPFSCAQFIERAEQRDHVRLRLLATLTQVFSWPAALITLIFLLVFFIVFGAILFTCLLLWLCMCCCCGCWTSSSGKKFDTCIHVWLFTSLGLACLVMAIPFLIFFCAWSTVAVVLWLLLIPCGADSDCLKIMLAVPFMTILTTAESINRADRQQAPG